MKKNIIIAIFFVLLVATLGSMRYFQEKIVLDNQENFQALSLEEVTHEKVIDTIYAGIKIAKENGDYRCCIEPDCTMCYISANKWNYGKAGTCACDDFIARGEDPCPQCIKGLSYIHDEDGISCALDGQSSGCEASLKKEEEEEGV